MRKNKHIGQLLGAVVSGGGTPFLDVYSGDAKFGWATKSLATAYNNSKAFKVKISISSVATYEDIYFIDGVLDTASIQALSDSNGGGHIVYIVEIYDHLSGTMIGDVLEVGTNNSQYCPYIHDGTSMVTNLDGEYGIRFTGDTRLYHDTMLKADTYSSFIMLERQTTHDGMLHWSGQNEWMGFIRAGGTYAINNQMDNTISSLKLNDVSVTLNALNFSQDLTQLDSKVISMMDWSVNTGWNDGGFVFGGYPWGFGNTKLDAIITGEIQYTADQTSDESDMVAALQTQFNIT